MREYLFSPDIVRLVFVVGVSVSVIFYERMQLTTGGAIVPAFLALALEYPVSLLSTLAAGYLTWLIVNKVIVRRKILYGRRKFEVELLVGLCLVGISIVIERAVGAFTNADAALSTVGFLVPGIIAHDMFRQKPLRTTAAIGANVVILGCLELVFASALPVFGAHVRPVRALAAATGFDRHLLLPTIAISVLISMLLFTTLSVRCGGFIGAAYMAFMLPRWGDVLIVAGVAFLTWLVVVKIMMPRMLIFGRRKLSTMVLMAALIGWGADICVRLATDGHFEPGTGLPIMSLMVPALIANDAQRQGWARTVLGVGMATAGVAGLANLLAAVLVGTRLLSTARPPLTWIEAYGPYLFGVALALAAAGVWWLLRHRNAGVPA